MGQTIPERLQGANNIYYSSVDIDALKGTVVELEEVINLPWINAENRENAEALLWRVNAKRLLLTYLTHGYDGHDYNLIVTFTDDITPLAVEKGYSGTAKVLENVRAYADKVYDFMADAYVQSRRVLKEGESGAFELTTDSEAECRAVAEIFRDKIIKAEDLPTDELFKAGVNFIHAKSMILSDLHEVADFALASAEKLSVKHIEKMLKNNLSELSEACRMSEYYPVSGSSRASTGCIILCTPLDDEAECYIAHRYQDEAIRCLDASIFKGMTERGMADIFDYLDKSGYSLFIQGLNQYFGENKAEVYKASVRYARLDRHVVIVDNTGDRTLYSELLSAIEGDSELTVMDATFEYLPLPLYNDILKLLEDKAMLSGVTATEVRDSLPFMGYMGLNQMMSAYTLRKANWLQIGANHSDYNKEKARRYLEQLSAQTLLLDEGWGDYAQGIVNRDRIAFDYDSIKLANPANIRKILQGKYTIYEKCGMLVRYCTLYGDDKSVWKGLSAEEKGARLTEATKLLMAVLETGKDPVVEVLDKLSSATAGGLCVDGGKKIQYKSSCVEDYDWTVDAICHECFHGFQHTAMYGAWHDWYWTELGVTRGRIAEWCVNNAHYFNEGYAYSVQVMECEARAFAKDCLRDSDKKWHLVDFE